VWTTKQGWRGATPTLSSPQAAPPCVPRRLRTLCRRGSRRPWPPVSYQSTGRRDCWMRMAQHQQHACDKNNVRDCGRGTRSARPRAAPVTSCQRVCAAHRGAARSGLGRRARVRRLPSSLWILAPTKRKIETMRHTRACPVASAALPPAGQIGVVAGGDACASPLRPLATTQSTQCRAAAAPPSARARGAPAPTALPGQCGCELHSARLGGLTVRRRRGGPHVDPFAGAATRAWPGARSVRLAFTERCDSGYLFPIGIPIYWFRTEISGP